MRSEIIVHVGLQKTATKYLQEVFFPRLNNVAYIGRPYTQENYAFNSLQYADSSLYSVSAIGEEINRIENKMAKGSPILISDELLSGFIFYNFINRGMIAERLSKAIPDATIVLFLRNQIDLIVSLYNQYVKIGWFDNHLDKSFLHRPGKGFPLEKWADGARDWDVKNRFINHRSVFSPEHFRYSNIYSLYSDLFRKVHVFLYEDFRKDPKPSLLRLASILSTELPSEFDGKIQKKIVNKGLGNMQLRVQCIENKLAHIFPALNSKWAQMLVRGIPRFASDSNDSNKAYVISLLKERDIFRDNYALNKKLNLGMEKYPKQYFGDTV
jgi:hypothetical protein